MNTPDKTSLNSPEPNSNKAIIAALFGNGAVAITKLIAFLITTSTAMLAETLHSFADTFNQIFLLIGAKRAQKPADESHPFGYGQERYFWAFIVALSIFTIGAAFSIYEGIQKIIHPHPIQNPIWSFAALGLAVIFEGYALKVAWKEFQHWRNQNPGSLWESFKNSKDTAIMTVLFEDSAALVGLLIAAVCIGLTLLTGEPVFDGLGSIIIGFLLLIVAYFLGKKSMGLLIGEAATPEDKQRIKNAVESVEHVEQVIDILTLHLGPQDILVNLDVHFADGLSTDDVETVIDTIEKEIRTSVPAAKRIFIEAETLTRRQKNE